MPNWATLDMRGFFHPPGKENSTTMAMIPRRDFLKNSVSTVAALSAGGVSAVAADRPNILWITCEDISPYLGCYGCDVAETPNLDRMAAEGIRYTRAYANAPVCAVARSALLTGMHSSTLGTHQMRSHVQLPDSIPAFPKLFQSADYYCTNNSKEDYNSTFGRNPAVWNESSKTAHYKNRKPGQPFFAVFNFTVTHESQLSRERIEKYIEAKLIPQTPRVRPADIQLPPYHPDLPEIRQDWARLHDLITLMDTMVGEKLGELEKEGLADNTIVFFYSDHGGQLARSKRYIYNVGTQVPLIVRFPKKWQHLAPVKPGSEVDRLVSFVDLPKTVLSLAGLPVPEQMQGRVFLGPDMEYAPESVHFYRDRMATRYDFSRAVTDGRWYYIRNFMPHRPRGRDTRYGFSVQANWREWETHYASGQCDATQSQFFQSKAAVELFDTRNDPWHVKNLAAMPEQEERLRRLEKDLDRWMIETRDIGLIPEPMFSEFAGPGKEFKTLYEYAQSDSYPVARLLSLAKQASLGDPKSLSAHLSYARDDHPVARYWGAYGLFLVRSNTVEVQTALKKMIANDTMAANRIMAAQALDVCGDAEDAFKTILKEARETDEGYVFLFALNAFQYSHTDDRLTLEDWKRFQQKEPIEKSRSDTFGHIYAQRLIKDAVALWPQRRRVD
jgi:N-sulfoglucosamine sulfohydrolase